MAGFELTRNITIGQYLPTGSFIHRLDPRIKILAYSILVIAIGFSNTYLGNLIALSFSFLLVRFSRISVRYCLSGIKPAIPFICVLAILQLLFHGEIGSEAIVYFEYGVIHITDGSVQLVIVTISRLIEILLVSSVLTLSTSTTQLTHAIASILKPLRYVNFPTHEFSLIITIAIRFVPTFAMEMEKMMKAQASRGAEIGTAAWWNMVQRTKELFPIIIPLFQVAMTRAEDLVLAMEARCYTPGGTRTIYGQYKIGVRDYMVILFSIVLAYILIYPFSY
ncbi:energy-coupling factor transporter transmembrane component T family protein [Risungbinella massiliensis]|uniref:energy-coupling factor transporter transmembrane component T family protein n=1 Tax=Risungbinella massiliensis TaxID=1329796 RepID=UPI0005CC89F4|nr:energy-coupling factor transporter transmembrane protein EcfT [Risungbinella massiliensis]